MKLNGYQCDWKGCKTTWEGEENPNIEPSKVLVPTSYHFRAIAEDDSGKNYTTIYLCKKHACQALEDLLENTGHYPHYASEWLKKHTEVKPV